jgi:hypothetical protein
MGQRRNKDGTIHAHSENIQDCPHLDLSPTARALWNFVEWGRTRPTSLYYEALPNGAKMVVDAVAREMDLVERALKIEEPDIDNIRTGRPRGSRDDGTQAHPQGRKGRRRRLRPGHGT